MPPAYVKPYVKRGKTDAGDAEAICEAVTRPTMRFVPIKWVEQQAALVLHRTRDLLVLTVAMANRAARAIWAIMVRGEIYRMPALGSAVT
jgi:transposase